MHIFCAVVGAGVLALPQSVAWLGWVAGKQPGPAGSGPINS